MRLREFLAKTRALFTKSTCCRTTPSGCGASPSRGRHAGHQRLPLPAAHGPLEALDTKIKVLKRAAYGFGDDAYFSKIGAAFLGAS